MSGSDLPAPVANVNELSTSLGKNTLEVDKKQSFIDRMDVAVTAFLQNAKSNVALRTPQAVESNFRIFRQWSAEKIGKPSDGEGQLHVTSQPEVDEAADEVKAMYSYFSEIEELVMRHSQQLKALNETEAGLALFFQQKGYQEKIEEISAMSIDIGKTFSENVKQRSAQLNTMEQFGEFIQTFKNKAIQDSMDTSKRQETSRIEFDAFAHKLSLLQRSVSLSGSTVLGKDLPPSLDLTPVEKEFEHAKGQFITSKAKYQNLSTAMIDKAVLLEMKRDVDYRLHLEKVWRLNHGE
ncbi:Arfaptin-like domain-containing protein [Chytriomyces cf. hyalinus JEL632]|nr:Arfaptin-like domain-containing protein [Chytriomyces cf. hyalinus JEL632]